MPLLLNVAVMFLSSIVTPNGQFLHCAAVAFSERHNHSATWAGCLRRQIRPLTVGCGLASAANTVSSGGMWWRGLTSWSLRGPVRSLAQHDRKVYCYLVTLKSVITSPATSWRSGQE